MFPKWGVTTLMIVWLAKRVSTRSLARLRAHPVARTHTPIKPVRLSVLIVQMAKQLLRPRTRMALVPLSAWKTCADACLAK